MMLGCCESFIRLYTGPIQQNEDEKQFPTILYDCKFVCMCQVSLQCISTRTQTSICAWVSSNWVFLREKSWIWGFCFDHFGFSPMFPNKTTIILFSCCFLCSACLCSILIKFCWNLAPRGLFLSRLVKQEGKVSDEDIETKIWGEGSLASSWTAT